MRSVNECMGGWIARVIWRRKKRVDGWIEHERAYGPVGVLRIPPGDHGVVAGDAEERVGASRPRRIGVEPVFEQLLTEDVMPDFDGVSLPEESRPRGVEARAGSRDGTREVLDLGQIFGHLR